MIVDQKPVRVTYVEAIRNASLIAKIYLGTMVINVILLVMLSIISLDDKHVDDVYAYLGIFVGFCLGYSSLQGVLKDNAIQLRCAILSASMISCYLMWYYFYKDHELIIEIIGILTSTFAFSYIVMYKWIVDGFGWYRYNRFAHANPELLSMYYTFQVFKAMIFLDIEIFTVTLILVLVKTFRGDWLPLTAHLLLLIFEYAWAFLGMRAVRAENLTWTRVFLFLGLGGYVYAGLNLYWIFAQPRFLNNTSPNQYIVSLGLCVLVRTLMGYWLFKVANNFDQGLKEHIFDTGMEEMDYWGSGTNVSIINSDGDIIPNTNYHLMDEKHVIIENQIKNNNNNDDDNEYDNDDINGNYDQSKNNQTNDEMSSQIQSKTKSRYKDSQDISQSLAPAIGKIKFSTDFSISIGGKNVKKNSGVSSVQPSNNFQRTRLDSEDFD